MNSSAFCSPRSRWAVAVVVMASAACKAPPPPPAEAAPPAEAPVPPDVVAPPSEVSAVVPAVTATPTAVLAAPVRAVKLTGKTFLATWTFVPPKVGELFAVDVLVTDPSGKPVEGAKVGVDATMPAHGHGMMTDPVLTARGPGQWHAEGLKLHMHGAWELVVQVETAAGKERLTSPWDQPPEAAETP